MKSNFKRRVVVSGLGVVAPNGIGKDAFWQATLNGISGIKLLQSSTMPAQAWAVGTIPDFIAADHIDRKLANRTDRMTHFTFAAIQEALMDAQLSLEQENPQRVGAVIANTVGGVDFVLKQIHTLYTKGPRFISAYTAIAWLSVANVGQAAIRYNIQGYCKTPVNDSVGGLDAMGMAYTAIQRGMADILLTGGTEAFLNPFILQILAHQNQTSMSNNLQAYRPFDKRAMGLILAEGAGICILEEYEHARQRNAPIYGEIIAYSQTNDALGLLPPAADGKQYARAIQQTMQEGNIQPEQIAYFNLDGRATPATDQGEATALHLNNLTSIPVSVPRTTIGHSYAAAGAIDTITALLALKHELIPPTLNCEELDPHYQLDIVRNIPRTLTNQASANNARPVVLIGGRGLGGANVVLALKKGT